MIRCVRLWTGDDGSSHISEGHLTLGTGSSGDPVSTAIDVTQASFSETGSGGSLTWHTAPRRQLVVTLSGRPTVITPDGRSITLGPGDIMLAEDLTGSGHRWQLEHGADPWQRMYVVLAEGADVHFIARKS